MQYIYHKKISSHPQYQHGTCQYEPDNSLKLEFCNHKKDTFYVLQDCVFDIYAYSVSFVQLLKNHTNHNKVLSVLLIYVLIGHVLSSDLDRKNWHHKFHKLGFSDCELKIYDVLEHIQK